MQVLNSFPFRCCLRALGLAALLPLGAQAGTWRTDWNLLLDETYTDNVNLVDVGAQSDFVTQITPGMHIKGTGARSKMDLNVRVNSFSYLDNKNDNRLTLDMVGTGQVEAVDNFLFIDADVTASEQNTSAFTPDGAGLANASTNRAQFGTASLMPRAVWRFGQSGEGNFRYRASYSDSNSDTYNSQVFLDGLLSLATRPKVSKVGWRVLLTSQVADSKILTDTHGYTASAFALYQATTSLELNLHGGGERNDYQGEGLKDSGTYGAGLRWLPSSRTSLDVSATKRFFGTGYALVFSHERPSSIFRFSATRAIDTPSSTSILTVQDLTGLNTNVALQNQSRSLNETIRLNFTSKGVRNRVSLDLAHVKSNRLDQSSSSNSNVGDLATYSQVIEDSATLTWDYSLTRTANWINSVVFSSADGTGVTDATRDQVRFITGIRTNVGAYSNVGLQYRYTRSTGSASYNENAVQATLVHRF